MYILGAIDTEYKYAIINNYYEVIETACMTIL